MNWKMISGAGGMMLKAPVVSKMGSVVAKLQFLAVKYAPQLFMGLGITGQVGGMVLTGAATLKLQEMLDKHNAEKEAIESDRNILSDGEYNMMMLKLNAKMVVGMMGVYAPAVIVTGLSMAAFCKAYSIQQQRITNLTQALAAITEAFQLYRQRVIEEHGELQDYMYYNGLYEEKLTTVDPKTGEVIETGETKLVKGGKTSASDMNPYSKFFDESSSIWHRDSETNYMNLTILQSQLNDALHADGYLFFNDALRTLGMQPVKFGQEHGWLAAGKGGKDGYVDFGLSNGDEERTRAFVNGIEHSYLIQFNCDGYILDKVNQPDL